MLKALREFVTGRYESGPVRLMSTDDAITFASFNLCYYCRHPIDTTCQAFCVTSSSDGWTKVRHVPYCAEVEVP